jgi:putative DNA primase/helicase
VNDERLVPPPKDPMAVARQFVAERYTEIGGVIALRHHRGSFYGYAENHWPEDNDRRVTSELWRWLENAVYEKEVLGELVLAPFEPNRYKVANVLEALRAIGHIPQEVQPPAWLEEEQATSIDPGEFIPLANGILELSSRRLRPHTPEFFGLHVLPFAFDPSAPAPTRWLTFLDQLWPDDEESKRTLAEEFGYVVSGETSQQKAFLFVGPKRSGKGTIGRVLTGLVGAHNTAGPTLASLTQDFGLQPLIGRQLAIISDARLGLRADSMIAVERLLSITGEDSLTINRKYRESWTGRLPTRFLILTNELPRFTDSSGALASRFVILILTTSFYGREIPRLTDELLEEAPGIFNWALDGLDRLRERGHFLTPASAQEAQRHLEDLASPVGAFVRDLCDVGPVFEVTTDDLWAAWKQWCAEEGRDRPGTKAVFIRDLRAAVPRLTPVRPRDGEVRQRGYRGIGLRSQSVRPWTSPDHDGQTQADSGSPNRELWLSDASGPGWSGVTTTLGAGQPLIGDDDFLKVTFEKLKAGVITEKEWKAAHHAHRLLVRRR